MRTHKRDNIRISILPIFFSVVRREKRKHVNDKSDFHTAIFYTYCLCGLVAIDKYIVIVYCTANQFAGAICGAVIFLKYIIDFFSSANLVFNKTLIHLLSRIK